VKSVRSIAGAPALIASGSVRVLHIQRRYAVSASVERKPSSTTIKQTGGRERERGKKNFPFRSVPLFVIIDIKAKSINNIFMIECYTKFSIPYLLPSSQKLRISGSRFATVISSQGIVKRNCILFHELCT